MNEFSALVWCVWALVAYASVARFARAIEAFSPSARAARAGDTDDAPIELPPDLMAYAAQFNDQWAVEDAIKSIRERFAELQDWNLVRRSVGIGVIEGAT